MKNELVHRQAFAIVGISTRTSNELEANEVSARIPALWGRIYHEDVFNRIPAKASSGLVAVYSKYEGDHTAPYTLTLGAAVQSTDETPAGMEIVRVPEQDCLQFPVRGKMPDKLIETWIQIWSFFDESNPFERTYLADFEEYSPDGSQAEIYIGVKRANR